MGDVEWGFGRLPRATRLFERCVEQAELGGFTRIALPNRVMLAQCMMLARDFRSAAQHIRRVQEEAIQIKDRFLEMFAIHSESMVFQCEQRWSESLARLELALELARSYGASRFEYELLTQMAECERLRGGDGLPLVREAVAVARNQRVLEYCGPWTLGALARLTDSPAEREQALEEATALLARGAFRFNHVMFYQHAIETAGEAGDTQRVEGYLDALKRVLDAWHVIPALYASARARAAFVAA